MCWRIGVRVVVHEITRVCIWPCMYVWLYVCMSCVHVRPCVYVYGCLSGSYYLDMAALQCVFLHTLICNTRCSVLCCHDDLRIKSGTLSFFTFVLHSKNTGGWRGIKRHL